MSNRPMLESVRQNKHRAKRIRKGTQKVLETLFDEEVSDHEMPALGPMIEGNLYRGLVHLSGTPADSVRSFVFGMTLGLMLHNVYDGFMPTSYVLPAPNKIYWVTVNQFTNGRTELDLYVLQTNPLYKINAQFSEQMIEKLNALLTDDGHGNLLIIKNPANGKWNKENVRFIEIFRPITSTYTFINTQYESETCSLSKWSPFIVKANTVGFTVKNKPGTESKFRRMRLGIPVSHEDIDISTEMISNEDFVKNINTGGMNILDRLYRILLLNRDKLGLELNRNTIFRILQGIGVDFFFKTLLCQTTCMKVAAPDQIDEMTIITRTESQPFFTNQPTMITIEDRYDQMSRIPILSGGVNTRAENHDLVQAILNPDSFTWNLKYERPVDPIRLKGRNLATSLFDNDALPIIIKGLDKALTIHGGDSTKHTFLGMALSEYIDEELFFVKYVDPIMKQEVMTLVFKQNTVGHILNVADAYDQTTISVKLNEINFSGQTLAKLGIKTIGSVYNIEAKPQSENYPNRLRGWEFLPEQFLNSLTLQGVFDGLVFYRTTTVSVKDLPTTNSLECTIEPVPKFMATSDIFTILDREEFADTMPQIMFEQIAQHVCPVDHIGHASALFEETYAHYAKIHRVVALGFDGFAIERSLPVIHHFEGVRESMSETYYTVLCFNENDDALKGIVAEFEENLINFDLLKLDQPKIVYPVVHVKKKGDTLDCVTCCL